MLQLMLSFEGTSAPPDILDGVRQGKISAFCLFADKNVRSLEQLRALTASLHAAAAEGGQPPPIIGIDQEGGQLIAITHGATELPGNMALGATASPPLARAAGEVLGRELLALGINLNFAPVLDVNTNPANPVIGIRAFGDSPNWVSQLGVAMIQGLEGVGVVASAKHFPGHGDSSIDTHRSMARVDFGRQRINEIELYPFREAIKAGVGSILTGHVIFSEFDDDNPASVSPAIIRQLLRGELAYDGLVITDAMDMYAVSQRGTEQCVRDALSAGNDLVLLGHLPNQLKMLVDLQHLQDAQSAERIQRARQALSFETPSMDVIGSQGHIQIAKQIAEASITCVRDYARQVPMQLGSDTKLLVLQPRPQNLTPADTSANVNIMLGEEIAKFHPQTQIIEFDMDVSATTIRELTSAASTAQRIIIGTINVGEAPQQAELVTALLDAGNDVIAVALRTPYDVIYYPSVQTYLCTYGIRKVSMTALARVLFGEIDAEGVLPCALPDSHTI